MAIAAWKRVEKSPAYQRRKLFFKRLLSREIRVRIDRNANTVRVGGWWLDPALLHRDSIVYSLGVGENVAFDLALIREYGLQVHAFDPTPSSVRWVASQDLPDGFHFHPWAVAGADGELVLYPRKGKTGRQSEIMYTLDPEQSSGEEAIVAPAFALSGIASRLSHKKPNLIKMDIEGAEYEVLEEMLFSALRPRQLLVESHHRYLPDGQQKTLDAIERLRQAGYGVIAVSETGREISFSLDS